LLIAPIVIINGFLIIATIIERMMMTMAIRTTTVRGCPGTQTLGIIFIVVVVVVVVAAAVVVVVDIGGGNVVDISGGNVVVVVVLAIVAANSLVHGNGWRAGCIGSSIVLLANARICGRCIRIIVVVVGVGWFLRRSHVVGGGVDDDDVGILVFVTVIMIVLIITGGGEAVVAMSRLDEACNHVHGCQVVVVGGDSIRIGCLMDVAVVFVLLLLLLVINVIGS
jgi:hypothetical protein